MSEASTGRERIVVLLGHPLGHSLSPLLHNASFRAQNLPFVYRPHPVPPEDLGSAIRKLKDAGFAGANVTVPHKRSILQYLDAVSDIVTAVGAANTLVWKPGPSGGELYGDNTDVGGFLATLQNSPWIEMPCVILGSGGAARAVAYGILTSTSAPFVTVAARNPDRVQSLVGSLSNYDGGGRLRALDIADAGPSIRDAGLIVNATPVGMHPRVDASPWPRPSDFHPGQLAYDLIYNPSETRFMREAQRAGAQTMSGLEMLIQQAALSYRQWTGTPMNIEAARTALNP